MSGERFTVYLAQRPYESWIEMNGQRLETVTSISVNQSAKSLPKVLLELSPDAVVFFGEAPAEFKIEDEPLPNFGIPYRNRAVGYDPYNSANAD